MEKRHKILFSSQLRNNYSCNDIAVPIASFKPGESKYLKKTDMKKYSKTEKSCFAYISGIITAVMTISTSLGVFQPGESKYVKKPDINNHLP
jgi:hypothetical protein